MARKRSQRACHTALCRATAADTASSSRKMAGKEPVDTARKPNGKGGQGGEPAPTVVRALSPSHTATRKRFPMHRAPSVLCLSLAIGLLGVGCQQFNPPVQPNVSLFPTVFPVRVLDQSAATDLPVACLEEVIQHASWQDGFGQFGLSEANADLIVRGLRRRGYAELDARRAGGTIRWVAFRVLPGGDTMAVTAGYDRRPPAAHLAGTDLTVAPTESPRRDAYNYPLKIETWQGQRGNVPMEVEHILPLAEGREEHWEIRHLVPLRDREG